MILLGDVEASTTIPVRLILPTVQFCLLAAIFKVFADLMPATMHTYCMATSTEMMKDRNTIESVVQQQKLEKNERNYRVFQAMRLMRREYMKMLLCDNSISEDGSSEYGDELRHVSIHSDTAQSEVQQPMSNKRLKEVTVKHIMENFHKLGKPADRSTYMRGSHSTQSASEHDSDDSDSVRGGSYRYGSVDDANWVVGVDKIHHLISMCGGDLDKFESFYLLRRSTNYVSTDIFPP